MFSVVAGAIVTNYAIGRGPRLPRRNAILGCQQQLDRGNPSIAACAVIVLRRQEGRVVIAFHWRRLGVIFGLLLPACG